MRFPYTVVITPPTAAELSTAARTWWTWALGTGIGILGATFMLSHRVEPLPTGLEAVLQVSSAPAGATIMVDGRVSGRTPAELALSPGDHQVRLEQDGYLSVPGSITLEAGETAALHEELWLRLPQLLRLRTIFPGAAVTDARFLQDGALALTVGLRPGDERQLWLRNRRDALRRIGPPQARGPLAVTPDGRRVAYLAPSKSAPMTTLSFEVHLDEVWLTEQDGTGGQRLFALPATAGSERLVDLGWAPDGHHLLVVSRQHRPDGGLRARVLLLDTRASGTGPQELLHLPGDIVPASFAWSPDGRWAAFLVRAGQRTALCLVGIEDGAFRYLADLGADAPGPLPFPAVAWSPDSRQLLYAAPSQDRTGQGLWPLGAKAPQTLFVADPADLGGGRLLRGAQGQAPIWRADGAMLTLAQAKSNGPLTLRAITPAGQTQDLTTLSLSAGTLAAVRWDVTHAQALVVMRRSTGLSLGLDQSAGQLDYWLVRFRTEREEVTR